MVRRNVSRVSRSTSSRSDQARAVADVLNRMREVVDEAGRDAAEHRLPLLPLDVFLQLDEAIGHRVEGVAELAELVACADVDARLELAGGHAPACRASA